MRKLSPNRLLIVAALVGAALAGVVAIGALEGTAPAGAAPQYTSCSTFDGIGVVGQTETMSGCDGPTGGSGVIPGPLASPFVITWANGGTTTIIYHVGVHTRSKCQTGATDETMRGRATKSTGAAATINGVFYATVCLVPDGALSLRIHKSVLLQTK